jgi:hypothetical protein
MSNLESQLNELMIKNPKKFIELIERTNCNYKEKYNRDYKTKIKILDGNNSDDYFNSLDILNNWIDKCIDEIRNHIKQISYPLFVYLYLELINKDLWDEGKIY